MPKHAKNEAQALLKSGALGIGEDHTKPDGRILAIQLLNQPDLVKHLFVELTVQHVFLLEQAKALADAGRPLEEIERAAPNGGAFDCSITQAKVIATALVNKIPVYAADDRTMARFPDNFKKRHMTIAAKFEEVTKVRNARANESAGCLLLWGSDHFVGKQELGKEPYPLEQFIEGLPYIVMGESDSDDSDSDDSGADDSDSD
jgi:hypothetical protein